MNEHLLDTLKLYYETFYRQNVAISPKKVKEIEYFLTWLRNEARPEDISYTPIEFYKKECTLTMYLDYFFSLGSTTTRHYDMTRQGTVILVDTERLSDIYSDVFYSKEASTEAAPKKVKDIAHELGRGILKDYDQDTVLSKVKILECDMTIPEKDYLYSCTLKYPFPDKRGTIINSTYFTIWGCNLISTPSPKKKHVGFFS